MTVTRYSSIEMIERLIAFDTVSARSNLALMEFVADYLARHGVDCRWTYNADKTKANLLATAGPVREGGVVLSGHTDVVPVDGQDWSSDPFRAVQRDGRLYGRGAADMKSFVAIALAQLPAMLERPLKRPIHLALTYDEEVGCLGVPVLISDLVDAVPRPEMVIVGEPTGMQIVNGQKGCRVFRTSIDGCPAHSSQPHRGANAIVAAAALIHYLEEVFAERLAQAPADCPYVPPAATFNVGRIQGGEALNIIAGHCYFDWEFRPLPSDDADAIEAAFNRHAESVVLPKLRAVAPDAAITTERLALVAPMGREPDGAAEHLVRRLTGANDEAVVSFGSEAGFFQEAGFSTIIFGPGSIDQAHQPDEFIELSQVAACEAFLHKLADWAAGEAA